MDPFKIDRRLLEGAGDDGDKGGGGNGAGAGEGEGEGSGEGEGQGEGERKTILGAGEGSGEGEGQAGEWSWGENVAGEGTVPPWFKADKYATIADQAKATPELEAKLGPAGELLGAPEGDYELPTIPEGTEGSWDAEDAMLVKFFETAKSLNLSQDAVNKLISPMAELIGVETAERETKVSDALAAIGTNSAARIEQVDAFLVSELGDDGANALTDCIGTDVNGYLALEKLAGLAAGDAQLSSLPGKRGPGFTKQDILDEQFKVFPEGHALAGKRMYEHDKDHRAKVDGMFKELFPGEDVQTVG